MKRFLFSVIAALTCMLTFAQSVGDYIYTASGRVKIVSSVNEVDNGNFVDETTGWTVDGSTALSADTFAVVSEAGPNGDNALYTLLKENGAQTGSCLFKRVPVSSGLTYYVSYYVKTDETTSSTISYDTTNKNYQNVFFNTDGQLYAGSALNVAESYGKVVETVAGEWKKVEYAVTVPSDGYICFYMYAPYIGQCFADFKVLVAQSVPDDRIAAKAIAKLQAYIDDERWTNGKEDLADIIGSINAAVAEDNVADFNAYVSAIDEEIIAEFLDQNTANISSRLDMQDFDNATVSNSSLTSVGQWKIAFEGDKSRWVVRAPQGGVDSPLKTVHLGRNVPGNFELTASTVSQSVNLPAGTYMYTMRVNACRYTNKNNTTKVEGADIRNLFVFIGKDTIECTDVDTLAMQRYTVYTTLTEPSTVEVGFCMKSPSCHNVSLDLTELRAIDKTEEEIIDYDNSVKFATAKQNLAEQIATAKEMYDSKEYVFAKALLNDSIVRSQTVYDLYTEYSEESLDSVNNQTKRLGRALSYYKTQNAEYVALAASIAEGEEVSSDASLTGDKTTLNNAIGAGKNYYNSLTVDSERDSTALVGYSKAIADAITALKQGELSADEMFKFFEWSKQDGATFDSYITGEPITISAGSNWTKLYKEGGKFAGNDMSSRFAFLDGSTRGLKAEKGMTVQSAKNAVFMSITGLKAGNEVTVDWSISNGSLFVGSGNVKYTDDNGEEHVLTKNGAIQNIKVTENALPTTNTEGLNGTHRITFIMTADGTLDFAHGSASTTTFAYIGINQEPTAVKGVAASDAATGIAGAYKAVENGRIVIKSANGTYNVAGARMK